MLVPDASVLSVALLDDGQDGALCRARLAGQRLTAPSLVDLEVTSVWRGLVRADRLDPARVDAAIEDLRSLPMRRVDHVQLLGRCWELRDNLTPFDAAYVALTEALGAVLLTVDRRLARASGPRCDIEVVAVRR